VFGPEKRPAVRLHLAAVKLAVTHPRTGKRLVLEVAPPPEMAGWLARCS
jgi:hypothetical protein